ncbi:MAG: GNAT family N-acetyltransferase [Varibaculum sp.]|nr:GNAT family N-acetyltransferase [Varibaculum sp.]
MFDTVELTLRDVSDLTALVNRIEELDRAPFRTSAAEMTELLQGDSRGLGYWIDGGRLVGYSLAYRQANGNVRCTGGVDPNVRGRGIGHHCISWSTEQAREMLIGGHGHIGVTVEFESPELIEHLLAKGYRETNSYAEMQVNLADYTPLVWRASALIDIHPWSAEMDRQVLRAHNRIVAGFGLELDEDHWLQGRSDFAPECSFIAFDRRNDRSPIVGYAMSSIYAQDWTAIGSRQGYIDRFVVYPAPRISRSIIGAGLLNAVLAAFRAEGLETAGAGAEIGGHAIDLYRRVGFQVSSTVREFEITV